MKIKGEVTAKNEAGRGQGHSQVRISATVDVGDGVERSAEVIISTADRELVGSFSIDEKVALVSE